MVLSRDFQEISVLECILGGLHIGVDVESEPDRARTKLAKSKIDALIIDCDLCGASSFLQGLQDGTIRNAVPLIIVSGSTGPKAPGVQRRFIRLRKTHLRGASRPHPVRRAQYDPG